MIALPLLLAVSGIPQDDTPAPKTPPEYGVVHWNRRLDTTLTTAAKSKRPVLLVFQEVPG